MARFRYWLFVVLVLLVAAMAGVFLPTGWLSQALVPVLAGVTMLLINRLLGGPNVVIEDLDSRVSISIRMANAKQANPGFVECFLRGVVLNKSPVGVGDLKSLVLRVWPTGKEEEYLDIPWDGNHTSFAPNSRLPGSQLRFIRTIPDYDWAGLTGRYSEIRLDVIGQRLKKYSTRIAEEIITE